MSRLIRFQASLSGRAWQLLLHAGRSAPVCGLQEEVPRG